MAANKKITNAQIAEDTGVSPATVSRALNHPELVGKETLERISESMRSLGYRGNVRTAARLNRSPLIVVNIPWLDNPFYAELVRGIRMAAKMRQAELVVWWGTPDAKNIEGFCHTIDRCAADGVITLAPLSLEALQQIQRKAPVVQCTECHMDAGVPYVTVDDAAIGRAALDHLIGCGCETLAIVSGPHAYKFTRERLKGFLDAAHARGLEVRRDRILQMPDISYDLAFSAVCHMLDASDVPDGIFTCSDTFGAAVIRAAAQAGLKVPDDLMIVSVDNVDIARMTTPTLTTVNQPRYQMGFSACKMLMEIMDGTEGATSSMVFDTELVVRESTVRR